MELKRARSLLDAERAQVLRLLADLDTARTEEDEAGRVRPIQRRHWHKRASTTQWPPDCRTGSQRSIGLSSG